MADHRNDPMQLWVGSWPLEPTHRRPSGDRADPARAEEPGAASPTAKGDSAPAPASPETP